MRDRRRLKKTINTTPTMTVQMKILLINSLRRILKMRLHKTSLSPSRTSWKWRLLNSLETKTTRKQIFINLCFKNWTPLTYSKSILNNAPKPFWTETVCWLTRRNYRLECSRSLESKSVRRSSAIGMIRMVWD
jgi:hypothetical protein